MPGEVATARGAAACDIIMVLPPCLSCSPFVHFKKNTSTRLKDILVNSTYL